MQSSSIFDAREALVGQNCIRPDPFENPGRRSMYEQASKVRGFCPQTGVRIVPPTLPIDPLNPANNANLLGIGERASWADYPFASALDTKWCGFSKCGNLDCQKCKCANLRDPCTFANGSWNSPSGCNRLWFSRSPTGSGPQEGNINGSIRWG